MMHSMLLPWDVPTAFIHDFQSVRAPRLSTDQICDRAHRRMPTCRLPLWADDLLVCCEDHRPIPTIMEKAVTNAAHSLKKKTQCIAEKYIIELYEQCCMPSTIENKKSKPLNAISQSNTQMKLQDFRLGRSRKCSHRATQWHSEGVLRGDCHSKTFCEKVHPRQCTRCLIFKILTCSAPKPLVLWHGADAKSSKKNQDYILMNSF